MKDFVSGDDDTRLKPFSIRREPHQRFATHECFCLVDAPLID